MFILEIYKKEREQMSSDFFYTLIETDAHNYMWSQKGELESKGIIVENVFWEELGLLIDTPNTFTPEYLPKE